MKKLLVAIPAVLLLAACATNAPVTGNHQANMVTMTCEDGGQVLAAYSNKGQMANLNVSLPKIGLNNQKMTLNQAVSGSGARYVNNADPKVSYEWHTKADYGVMSVGMANGQTYSVNCKI
ncbi:MULTISPECIES: MliC family protein [unclassified Psychrobacter]|uniref:MliC family protein n=1 Tax=unclassified Psychrobacter TaxID=196806 RepID=UPI0025E1CE0E|nr:MULTISPECIES: MliC family protein [unclassified Psychrobacter]